MEAKDSRPSSDQQVATFNRLRIRGEKEDLEVRRDVKYLQDLCKKIALLMSPDAGMLSAITRKYISMYDELKESESTVMAWRRSYEYAKRECEHKIRQNNSLAAKSKLESWHQELQRQNKRIKEEMRQNMYNNKQDGTCSFPSSSSCNNHNNNNNSNKRNASIYTLAKLGGNDRLEITKKVVNELKNLSVGTPNNLHLVEQFFSDGDNHPNNNKSNEAAVLLKEKNELLDKLQQLDAFTNIQSAEIQSLEKQISILDTKIANSDKEMCAQESKFKSEVNKNGVLIKKLMMAEERVKSLENELSSSEMKVNVLQAKLSSSEREINALKTKLNEELTARNILQEHSMKIEEQLKMDNQELSELLAFERNNVIKLEKELSLTNDLKYDKEELLSKCLKLVEEVEKTRNATWRMKKKYHLLRSEKTRCIEKLRNYVLLEETPAEETIPEVSSEEEIVKFLEEQYEELSKSGLIETENLLDEKPCFSSEKSSSVNDEDATIATDYLEEIEEELLEETEN